MGSTQLKAARPRYKCVCGGASSGLAKANVERGRGSSEHSVGWQRHQPWRGGEFADLGSSPVLLWRWWMQVFAVLSSSLHGGDVSVHTPVPNMDLEDIQVVHNTRLTGEPHNGSTLVREPGPHTPQHSLAGASLALSAPRWYASLTHIPPSTACLGLP
jgi:hypothetical protein